MLKNTLKTALAVLRRKPFFTGVSLFAICFTLTVLMTATTLLENMSRPGLPIARQETLATLEYAQMWGPENDWTGNPGYRLLDTVLRDLPGVELASIHSDASPRLYWHEGEKHALDLKFTDAAFWRVFSFTILEGRLYDEAEVQAAEPLAVITRSTRDLLYPQGALDQSLRIGDRDFRVIGVVEDVPIYNKHPRSDVWVPLGNQASAAWRDNWMGSMLAAVRLTDSRALPQVRAELARRCAEIDPDDGPGFDHISASLDSSPMDALARELLAPGTRGDTNSYLGRLAALIIGAALLFMSLPALNLVNLNLSRMLERASEIGVRRAFGATAGSLILQLLIENLLIVSAGGVLALGCTQLILDGIARSGLLQNASFHLNLRVFGLALVLVVVFSVLSGILPAWRTARLHPVHALKGNQR
ncbi:MAG: ABC transporter permease [Candidatus Cloacimonetes bacterium]|nr:ABC transporter permease [Candidatus Cloacimonadota bacterium]